MSPGPCFTTCGAPPEHSDSCQALRKKRLMDLAACCFNTFSRHTHRATLPCPARMHTKVQHADT